MEDIELAIHGDTIVDRNSADSYFRANFGGGSYIKGLVAQLSLFSNTATFVFEEESITLISDYFNSDILVYLDLDTSTFPYEFSSTDSIVVTISLKDLNNALSSISKSSGVILEKTVGKDILNVIPTEAVSGMPLTSRSNIRFTPQRTRCQLDIESYEYTNSPTCAIKTNKLSQMFSNFCKNKVGRVECFTSPSGIKFEGNNTLATNTIQHVFGNFDSEFDTLPNMIAIRTDVCKSLTKLGSLNNDGEVRIFHSSTHPHLFVVPVSNYGTFNIYIADMRTQEAIDQEFDMLEAQSD